MATSGSINLTATGTDIITEALEQLGVLAEGESPSTAALTSCNRTLNYLIKAWQMEGLNLFALKKTYLFLQENTNAYTLSSSGSHWTDTFYSTQVATAAVATDTTIDVDSITNISDGDYIGIQCADGTMHWTTVNGAPAGSTVTLTDALDAAVAVDAYVYTYTTKAGQPLDIDRIVRRDVNNNDVPVHIAPLEEYSRLTPKTSDGPVLYVYFDPQRTQFNMNVWPETDDVTDYLVCYTVRKLDDIDTVATDEVDFPQEWFLPLSLNLATLLIPKYGTPPSHAALVSKLAKYWKDTAEGWDSEDGFQIQPASQNNQD